MRADFIIFGTQQTPTAPPPAGRCDRGKEKPHFPCLLRGIKNTPLCRAAVRINSLSLSLSLSLTPPLSLPPCLQAWSQNRWCLLDACLPPQLSFPGGDSLQFPAVPTLVRRTVCVCPRGNSPSSSGQRLQSPSRTATWLNAKRWYRRASVSSGPPSSAGIGGEVLNLSSSHLQNGSNSLSLAVQKE